MIRKSKLIIIMLIFQVLLGEIIFVYNLSFSDKKKYDLAFIKGDSNKIMIRNNSLKKSTIMKKICEKDNFVLNNICETKEENKLVDTISSNDNITMDNNNLLYDDMDLFENDGLQLKQWYFPDKVKEKWKEKHIENVRDNYKKVLLNNKYNELFNMYRNIKKNNIENYKKRVKTNRINPVIYIKKRLVSATAKHIKMSFMKTRKILWKIRYMPIIKAFAFLYYYGTNKYTVNIYKCIKSCLHNAINKYGRNNIKPVFHTLQANMGGYTKKINIRARGKTDIIREPHTHIRVVLEV
ncbi:putative 50S ribosomal protein L22, apicoplast [Plasmodium gaboni]|uniref:Putative 50S ribosomal protein L22, apicoplast n=1 Tax=Plasmodium gaboni TaxID=647221 RepID=A0A151LBD7_9APIC|nr:putative 50S ribosomal protein L22, apicoplast [Plasmodium gaboni]KYN96262.1 putative 50S ribosomal protein L22, apicoplast [Plasmodium gaboni]